MAGAQNEPFNHATKVEHSDYRIAQEIIDESFSRCEELGLFHDTTTVRAEIKRARVAKSRSSVDKEMARASQTSIEEALRTLSFSCAFAVFNKHGLLVNCVSTIEGFPREPLGTLTLWQEGTVGPMAHQFAIERSRAALLEGRQHLLDALKSFWEVSAPILDAHARPCGAITAVLKEGDETAAEFFAEAMIYLTKAIAKNITQTLSERALARQLASSEDLAANILGYVDDGIVLVNSNGVIKRANKAAQTSLGIDPSDETTMVLHRYLKSDTNLLTLICSGSIFNNKRTLVETSHGPLDCSISCRPLANTGESPISIIHIRGLGETTTHVMELRDISGDTFDSIIGCNPRMLKTFEEAKFFASANASVLIVGATGTGKSQLAHAIHNAFRPEAPFVTVNCGALPKNGADRLLFGSADNDTDVMGLLEQANGGTLYLDEICDLSPDNQALLLTLNDSRYFSRVGSPMRQKTNFRIIASSTRQLYDQLDDGRFRADLYYRIAVVKLEMLDLADRIDDVPLIARHIVKLYCATRKVPSISISNEALNALVNYSWPGNVRQLRTSINYACDTCKNRVITAADLPTDITRESKLDSGDNQSIESLDETRRKQIVGALRRTDGNVAMAAKVLGIGRSTLYKLIKRYNIPRNAN